MAFKIIYSEEANKDLQNGIEYYIENASKKVADKFYKSVRQSVKSLKTNPYYQIRSGNFRALPLKNYPFLIFFSVSESENTVLIARIFHASQNPGKYP